MDKDLVLIEIKVDYNNELIFFLTDNPLLNEKYFIDFKLKGLKTVLEKYEEIGEFYQGNEEFKYGKKSVNRNLFGYYFLYSEFLVSKKLELNITNFKEKIKKTEFEQLIKPTNKIADELFYWFVECYRPEVKTSVKFVNILHYLKNDSDKNIYIFNLTQKEYHFMIKNEFDIDIKKFQKSERYDNNELPVLHKIERTFRDARSEN